MRPNTRDSAELYSHSVLPNTRITRLYCIRLHVVKRTGNGQSGNAAASVASRGKKPTAARRQMPEGGLRIALQASARDKNHWFRDEYRLCDATLCPLAGATRLPHPLSVSAFITSPKLSAFNRVISIVTLTLIGPVNNLVTTLCIVTDDRTTGGRELT